jgi:hypothetical protein
MTSVSRGCHSQTGRISGGAGDISGFADDRVGISLTRSRAEVRFRPEAIAHWRFSSARWRSQLIWKPVDCFYPPPCGRGRGHSFRGNRWRRSLPEFHRHLEAFRAARLGFKVADQVDPLIFLKRQATDVLVEKNDASTFKQASQFCPGREHMQRLLRAFDGRPQV